MTAFIVVALIVLWACLYYPREFHRVLLWIPVETRKLLGIMHAKPVETTMILVVGTICIGEIMT
jgi:hypothetical protein